MHSSKMRTARLLTVSRSIRRGEGVCLGAVYLSMQWGRYPPPPRNRITDRCKNMISPQTSFAGGKNRAQFRYV